MGRPVIAETFVVVCLLVGLFGLALCLIAVPFLVRDWTNRRAELKARAEAGDLLVLARALGVLVE
jgi:hypothetical protein